MDEETLTELFAIFKKIERDRNLNKHGCGLGLFISKNLALALGGDIRVESERGKGTCFNLTIK